jgi:heptosyltransferase-2
MTPSPDTIHTDCRHYRGDRPCVPNKERGKECADCDEFDPLGERLLLIKLGAPGDVLRTTALLPGIRRKWPNCELTWLTREDAAELLLHLDSIDRIVSVESEGIDQIRGETFDLCLNLDNEPLASSIANQIQSREKRGYILDTRGCVIAANPEAGPWLRMACFDRIKKENRSTYQEHMRRIVGIPSDPIDPIQIDLTDKEKEFADVRLHDLGIKEAKPIAFNTGAGSRWLTKRWPMESFLELSLLLAESSMDRILLLGGPQEDKENQLLAAERPDRFVYPGVLPLRRFMAMVARCGLLVTADTLALHVGLGANVPTVVLFGPTSATEIEGTGPLLKVTPPIECECYYRQECSRTTSCMAEISPETVANALAGEGWLEALSQGEPGSLE